MVYQQGYPGKESTHEDGNEGRGVETDKGILAVALVRDVACELRWVEIVENGAGILADADYQRIIEAYGRLAGTQVVFPPLYGNGDSSERILSEIVVYLG